MRFQKLPRLAGKYVYVEKPFVTSTKEAQKLERMALGKGPSFM